MKRAVFGILVLTLCASPSWAAGLKMTISDGRVSIDAQDVTIRQILAEWARLGKTQIVNLERVASGPITLKIEDVPEKEALDIILRTVPGHIEVPRAAYLPGASVYERILILASATTVTVAARPQTPTFPSPMSPNITQLRSGLTPGMLSDPAGDPAADQRDDPALAAAAAVGLIPVPALMPAPTTLYPANMPALMLPPGSQAPPQTAPAVTQPSNPFNTQPGTSRPTLAPPPPPTPTTGPPLLMRPRPPQADQ